MPAFRYDKRADWRDQDAARRIRDEPDMYSQHTERHLRNALRFARGCFGSEAKAREYMIRQEMRKRGLC